MFEDGERIRRRVHDALGVEQPHPSLRSRVIASMPVEQDQVRPRWRWAAGAVATVLALALVGSLVYIRGAARPQTTPAGRVVGSLSITTRLDFSCTLPVQVDQSMVRVRLPDGQATVDQVPISGKGGGGNTYVRGRWLPVPPEWLSADGRSYAYATNTSGVPGQPSTSAVVVHDVASGRDRQVWNAAGSTQMLAWTSDTVYVSHAPDPASPGDIWAVDPAAGGAHRVGPNPAGDRTSPGFSGARFGAGGAWIVVAAGQPQGSGTAARGPDVRRMDLRDGTVSTWFAAPAGRIVSIIGMDAQGHPVLALGSQPRPPSGPSPTPDPASVYPPPPVLLLLTGPDQTVTLSDGSNPALRPSGAVGDGRGIWFAAPGTLWLYRQGELIEVASVPSRLFPAQTTPSGGKGGVPSPPAGYPTGPYLQLEGGCA